MPPRHENERKHELKDIQQITEENTTESVLVAFDVKPGGNKVLLVGKKKKNQAVDIINAFQGEEAQKIWDMLITRKEKKDDQT